MAEPKIKGGYILLSRKLIESKIFDKPPLYLKVWVYLMTKAQHKEYNKLKRGQLWTSIPEIMEACSWYIGYRKVIPKKSKIYTIIDWLRNPYEGNDEPNNKETMIATTKGTHGMLVNIVNYNVYQTSKNYESNDESNDENLTKELRKEQESNNINKNDKNDKNDINNNMLIDDFFERIWKLLPRKKGKSKVTKKTKKFLFNEVGEDSLVEAIKLFNKEMKGKDKQFIPYGSTFLNGGYEDYLELAKDKKEKEVIPTGKIKYITDEDIQREIDEKHKEKIRKAEEVKKKIVYYDR